LTGTIKISGTNLATFGSKPEIKRILIIEVETNHQKIRFNRYLKPDLE
jgi:hypothetical protein